MVVIHLGTEEATLLNIKYLRRAHNTRSGQSCPGLKKIWKILNTVNYKLFIFIVK